MKNENNGKIKILPNLIKMLKGLLFIMLLAIINGTLGFICSMSITILGAVGIAGLVNNTVYINIYLLIGLIIGLGFLRGFLRYLEQYQNHYMAFRLLAAIRLKIFKTLKKLDQAKLEKMKKGNLLSLITSDIELLEVFYAHTISPIFIAITTSLVLILTTGFLINWWIALLAFLSFLIIGLINPLIQARIIKKDGEKYRSIFSSFNSFFLDSLRGIKELTLYKAVNRRKEKITTLSNKLIHYTKKINYKNTFNFSFTAFLISSLIMINLGFLIFLYFNKALNLGQIILAFTIISGGFGPVIALSNLPSSLNQTFASAKRVVHIVNEKSNLCKIENEKDILIDNIEFKNVSFSYTKKTPILDDISFTAKKGEIIGIIGKSGEGKSTILKLLMNFYKADSGQILYNQTSIDKINTNSLLDNFTLLNQVPYLFQTTILDNIKLGNINADDNLVKDAINKASLTNFINNLPDGLNTILDSKANNISQGERQRISLARAFLKGSKIILLDEPTSNVDAINESIILKSLIKNKQNYIIIIVSHRKSTIAICDKVYKLENKKLSEVRK